ncbi:coiled-coil domain-containing protein 146 isoform X2 [Hydra vulgaris]|uniref:Coiled-coil domain-containing protein 146 isoform X2 n=1 Tax=Hydra vulgaris TaxID=6087 RepID=A0ABM4D4F4_HYDVU
MEVRILEEESVEEKNFYKQTKSLVSADFNTGLQCLEELCKKADISDEKYLILKSKYVKLINSYDAATEMEKKYINEGIKLLEIIEKQTAELQKSEQFPFDDDSEVNKLRLTYLKYNNELAASTERIINMEYQLESLLEEKKVLQQEVFRMPNQEEVDACVIKYKDEVESLRQEVNERTNECKHLNEECMTKSNRIMVLQKEMENIGKEELDQKEELIRMHNDHLSKKSELIIGKLRKTSEKAKLCDIAVQEINIGISEMIDRVTALDKEKENLIVVLEQLQETCQKKEKEADLLVREYEFGKDHQAELLGDRVTLDLKMMHLAIELKTEFRLNARKLKERDKELKHLKKAELQLSAIEDSFAQTKLLLNDIKLQTSIENKDSLIEKRLNLQKEVEIVKKAFTNQKTLTTLEKQKFEIINQTESLYLMELTQLRSDIADLTRLAQIKVDSREQKIRDYQKAELRHNKMKKELRLKELSVHDHAKMYSDVHRRLGDFSKLYNIIKNERNKFVNLFQTSTQCAAELQERAKVLQNEVEILRNSAVEKERQFQKSKQVLLNDTIIRDNIRKDICKQQVKTSLLKEKSEQQKVSILALNNMIQIAEGDLVELKDRYEYSVQERNNRGLQLIERNEEVCALYEKENIQKNLIKNIDSMLHDCEEEFNFLKTESEDFKRSISILKSIVPNKNILNDELSFLQLQLAQTQKKILNIEEILENPLNSGHIRLLPGHEPSSEELLKKIEGLELKLSDVEEKLKEKNLIHEQLKKIVSKEQNLAEKEDSKSLARKVSDVQVKIKEATRKMMAIVSELSMNQALSMKYHQEVKEKEAFLQQCRTRLEQGIAPYDNAEQDWLRYLKDEERQLKAQAKKADEHLQQNMLPGVVITTAEPRPNAYIPDDSSSLPLPKPYGSNAPFKPTELGSNMRHIRKPLLKPIEI